MVFEARAGSESELADHGARLEKMETLRPLNQNSGKNIRKADSTNAPWQLVDAADSPHQTYNVLTSTKRRSLNA